MRILAIDPGGTTGLCYGSEDGISQRTQIPANDYLGLYTRLITIAPQIIVCERFDNRAIKGSDLSPVEVIGIVKLWAQQTGIPIVFQGSSQMKLFDDDKLRRLRLWLPNMRHAMDATSHWLYFTTTKLDCQNYLQQLRPD